MLPILIIRNFNPRAPYGARPRKQRLINAFTNFNPRAPYGARPQELFGICLQTNFNPRAPYGARLDPKYIKDMYHAISIHAPHTGRDCCKPRRKKSYCTFQSTRPIRGATFPHLRFCPATGISIHAPHTGRDGISSRAQISSGQFQSTRPIRGATIIFAVQGAEESIFQSTRPIRGATPSAPLA